MMRNKIFYINYAVIFIGVMLILTSIILKITAKPILENVSFSTAFYDNEGHLLRLTLAQDGIYRLYIPLEDISQYHQEATLMYEDKYFYYHFGINPVSVLRAVFSLFHNDSRPFGASTITMQLARLKYNINSKTFFGKLNQMFHALLLEIKYSKKEILEAYFNLAPYGHNIEGVEAASAIYYNIPSKEMTLFESFALVIIPQNPNNRAPTKKEGMEESIKSRKRIFPLWLKKHKEDEDLNSIINMEILVRHPANMPFIAPHLTDYLLKRGLRGHINTTINTQLQTLLESTIKRFIVDNRNSGIYNASAILLNHETMEVEAYVGSANYFNNEIEGQVNGIEAMRSPGSVLKPFIFGLGIDYGLIHPKSLMKDAPRQYGAYSPENSDRGFLGPLFARDALIHSRNIPAIELLTTLPKSSFYDLLYYSGVENLQSEEYYGTSLAIGGFEVTMENVAKMYAGLANFGEEKCINYQIDIKCEEDSYKMFSQEASFLVMDMLSYNPPVIDGFKNDFIPWKTGTSYAYRDAWSAGILGKYVLVVWVGNFNGQGNNAFLGRTSAGKLFFQTAAALKYNANEKFTRLIPKSRLNIKEVEICSPTGDLPNEFCPHKEMGYFIPGVSPIKVTDVYRSIPIDKETGLRACSYDKEKTEMQVFEFWPSDINKLFQQSGIQKKQPPKFMPGCKIDYISNTGNPPVIILPSNNSVYSITREKKDIYFKVNADSDANILYYFVDNRFLGTKSVGEAYFWQADIGSHTLTVTDNLGRSSSSKFTVDILQK